MTSGVATGPSPLAGDLRDVTLGTAVSPNLFIPPPREECEKQHFNIKRIHKLSIATHTGLKWILNDRNC